MDLKGRVKLIGETQTFDSGFTKRQLVVTTDETYPQDVAIDFVKDKCDVLNAYKAGDSVEVGINIRGNEYNGKYYVSLQGWKISKAEAVGNTPEEIPTEESEDLPF